MKKRLKKYLSVMGASMLMLSVSMSVFAADSEIISIPADMKWGTKYSASHNTGYSYVRARCHSVYPVSGVDNFSTIRCRIVNNSGTIISKESYVKLSEGSSDFTKINLKDGYINLSTVNFQFCGNTKASAQAVVSYRG